MVFWKRKKTEDRTAVRAGQEVRTALAVPEAVEVPAARTAAVVRPRRAPNQAARSRPNHAATATAIFPTYARAGRAGARHSTATR